VEVKEIVTKCLKGDAGAWKMLVDLYAKRIYNLAYQFSGTPQEAEDLVQDIFFKLYNSLGKYEPEKDFSAWFLTLARNYLIDEYRQHRQEKSLRDDFDELTLSATASDSPEHQYLARERTELIRQALSELSPELRTVLVLREIEGFSYEEIAEKLGLPVGTVKSRINRGRLQMAEVILKRTGGKL
jgi:RNA polymerase sigma-70 factor (ECF subfamily)